MERPGWRIRIDVEVDCTCDRSAYRLRTRYEAFEDDASVFRRTWDARIPRDDA